MILVHQPIDLDSWTKTTAQKVRTSLLLLLLLLLLPFPLSSSFVLRLLHISFDASTLPPPPARHPAPPRVSSYPSLSFSLFLTAEQGDTIVIVQHPEGGEKAVASGPICALQPPYLTYEVRERNDGGEREEGGGRNMFKKDEQNITIRG
eukprot:749439-Hanusia_phi.AAC.2